MKEQMMFATMGDEVKELQESVDRDVDELQDARAMCAVAGALFAMRSDAKTQPRIVVMLPDDDGDRREVRVYLEQLHDDIVRELAAALEERAKAIVGVVRARGRAR